MHYLFRFLSRSFIILITLMIVIAASVAMLYLFPADTLRNIQTSVDSIWWKVSLVRWIILALLIIKIIPWYIQRKCQSLSDQTNALSEEFAYAQSQNANYETLCDIEHQFIDMQKLKNAFDNIKKHYKWVATGLIGIEVLAVQLPHLL